jgi:hypothetical protein
MSPRVPKWYLVVVGAVAVQRLAELSLSRSNEAGIRGVRAASSCAVQKVHQAATRVRE